MNFIQKRLLIFVALLTIFSFIGPIETSFSVNEITIRNQKTLTPNIDGIIGTDEYISEISLSGGDYKLYWQIEGDTIFLGMVGKTTGWVAIGFDPTLAMQDADMIFGWVLSNSSVIIIDAFSTGPNGPHPADTDLGGNSDISAYNGTEESGNTIIEFSRLLTTGDQYDNDIPSSGTYNIIWALGNTDDFGLKHIQRGSATINLGETEESTKTESSSSQSESTTGFALTTILFFISMLLILRKTNDY
ncbi:MAG: hypothetical protein JSW11_07645 [Candidatus Heimdallarchaeota archaeon]|nr:MAG: hypothetical protein JSW11_07645 [Candidatus Heimdallarchaeota archaeon]